MRFTLQLDMTGSAFDYYAGDDNARNALAVALILRALSEKLYSLDILTDQNDGTLRDSNGNSVGTWEVAP